MSASNGGLQRGSWASTPPHRLWKTRPTRSACQLLGKPPKWIIHSWPGWLTSAYHRKLPRKGRTPNQWNPPNVNQELESSLVPAQVLLNRRSFKSVPFRWFVSRRIRGIPSKGLYRTEPPGESLVPSNQFAHVACSVAADIWPASHSLLLCVCVCVFLRKLVSH